MSADLLITGVDVLMAPGDLREGVDVVIRDGRIASIGPAASPGSAAPSGAAASESAAASAIESASVRGATEAGSGPQTTLDGTGLLAIPGLVNAHTHSPENPMRGLRDGLPLEPWLASLMEHAGPYSADDHYWCALASAAEILLTGGTSVIDHVGMTPIRPEAFDGAMTAYRDAGIRGGVAPLVSDFDATVALAADLGMDVGGLRALMPQQVPTLPTSEMLARTDDAIGRWHGAEGGRLHVLAGASGVQWASEELLGGMADLARARGTTWQLHCVETRIQAAACRLRFGKSGLAALDDLGGLGPETSLAHCVWIEPSDIDLIAARGATVVHNPAANQRLRSGRAPIAALLAAGAHVGIGTDGAASGDDQSAWIATRLAALIHRDPDEPWVSSDDALAMATSGGAHALGVPGLGTLEPGAPADLTLVDRRGLGLAGSYELEASLVWSESGPGVTHVIVAGEVVVRDGAPTRFDLAEVTAAMADQAARRRAEPVSAQLDLTVARLNELRRRLAERDGRPFFA